MIKNQTSKLLSIFSLVVTAALAGCTAGSGGLTSSPVFPKSNLDYSSHLERLQARSAESPYAPEGGFDDAPSRGPLFSMGSGLRNGGRSGSC